MPTTHLFQKAGTGSTQMRRLTAKQHQAMPEVFFRSLLRSYSPRPYWPVGNRCSHAANWTYDACVGAAGLRCAARGHRYAGEAEGKIPEGNKPAEVVLFSAISEFPKGRKYLISLSFRGKASVRLEAGRRLRCEHSHSRVDCSPRTRRSCRIQMGPVEADGAVDAQNAPTAPWKTLRVFHELHRAFPIKSFTKNPERPQNSVGKPG